MANWKTTVEIGDLHNAHQSGKLTIAEVANTLADRLAKNAYGKALAPVIKRLKKAKDTRAYDACLKAVYDFGDLDHRVWLNP